MTTKFDVTADIRRSTQRFIDETIAMSPAIWLRKPPTGGWSASEVIEHVTIANRGVGSILRKALVPLDEPVALADDEIPYLFYRGDEPPNVAPPTGTVTDVTPAIDGFRASADAIIEWTDGATIDLRASGRAHPVFGMMDGIQWMLFVTAHTERHRAQLIGLKQQEKT